MGQSTNRFIKTYERMDGPLNNYTQIKEVKELPSLEYTGEVYFSGSLADFAMSFLEITENPIDAQKFGKAFLNAPQIFFVPTLNELPAEGIDGCGYVIIDEKLLYVYSAEQKQYENVGEELSTQYGFVIGTDKSIVGTMDIETSLGWDDGTIGVYLIVSEPEDVSTSTIYKKEIMTEAGVVNTNYVFGEKIDMITVENQEAFQTKFTEILKSKGFNDELITNLLILSTGFTLASANLDFTDDSNSRVLSINMYDSGKYIYKNNQIIKSLGQTEPIEKEFNTIDELYNFINNLLIEVSNKNEELKQTIDSMAANNLEYKYTNEPLNDSNLFLNVVEEPIESKGTGVYQYYIYNGKEYIELGGEDSYIILNVDSVENFSGELTDKEIKIIKKENTNIIVTDGSIIVQCIKQLSMGNNIFFQAFDGTGTLVVTIDTTTKKYTGEMQFPLSSILLNGKEVEQFNGQAEINISNAEIIERTMITWGKLDNALTINEFNKLKNTKAILKITYNAIGCDFYLENPTVYTTNTSSSSLTQLIYNVSFPTSLSQFSNTPEALFIFKENTLNSFSYKYLNEYVPQVLGYISNIYNEIDIYPLLGFVTNSEYPKLHLPKSICLGKFVYNSDVYSFTPSSNPIIPFITTLSKVSTNHYGTFEAVLETTDNNRYSCILHITKESSGSNNTPTNSEGTFIIYDTTTNKVTYVLLKLKYNNESFAVDYLKAYQDGTEVTSTFVTKISSIYLNLL